MTFICRKMRTMRELVLLNFVLLTSLVIALSLNVLFINKIRTLNDDIAALNVEIKNSRKRSQPQDGVTQDTRRDLKTFDRAIPQSKTLGRQMVNAAKWQQWFTRDVTVLLHTVASQHECFMDQVKAINQTFPNINITISSSVDIDKIPGNIKHVHGVTSEGDALNKMINLVTTKYFLYMTDYSLPSVFDSDNSLIWLYHALENIPELDVVGGSYVRYNSSRKYPLLEVPCYRHKLCYWVFEQRYEYQYSVGDMMVCEETSSSFMARTSSLIKLPKFDEKLPAMVTTDFFHRAKKSAVVGLRPEVFFTVPAKCSPTQIPVASRVPFMEKYDITRIRDSFDVEYIKPDYKTQSSFIWHKHGGFHSVSMLEYLRKMMLIADDYFTSHNITYSIDSGVALGGIKMRDVLPWDTGDIDTAFWGESSTVRDGLEKQCKKMGIVCYFRFIAMGNGQQEIMMGLNPEYIDGGNTLFPRAETKSNDDFMYLHIHGRQIPVDRTLFQMLRHYYGDDYLRHKDHGGGNLKCRRQGHHACVPEQFQYGAGHWSDYYCHL